MVEEALVLSREVSGNERLRHSVDRHEDAPLVRVFRNEGTVVRMDARHHGWLVLGEAVVARQVVRGLPEEVAADRRADQK